MPDPIKDLYNSLKSTKLFLDENDFRQQLNKSPKEVFDIVSKEKQTSGLFIDFDDFENATGLKKKISEKVSEDGGKAGISALPSDSGKGFGELKPAKRQPAEVIKEPKIVGEDTLLTRKMDQAQRPAISTTGVRLPAAPKVVAEEKALERAAEPKLPKLTPVQEEQGYVSNLVSSLNRGFYSNLIGNPLKGFSTIIKEGTSAMTGGRVKEGPISDFLDKFADKYNKAIIELNPQDKEFQGSLSDQFGQALGQVGSLVFTGGAGVGGRGAALAEQALPKAVTAAAPKTIAGKIATKAAPAVEGVKRLAKEVATPASVSAGLTVGQSEFDRAKQKGASDEQAFEAFYKNAVVGSILEKIPVMQFLNRFNKATSGGFVNYLKTKGVSGVTGGLEEAVTEVLQQVYANKTAQDIYNINQNIFEGITESGGIGFGVGFLLNAMGAQAKILRQQGREEDAQALENQEKEFKAKAEGVPIEIPTEGRAGEFIEQFQKPSIEQQAKDIQEGKIVTFTYENEQQVPEVFKDKISSTGEINGEYKVKVTVPKSLADYELGKAAQPEAAPEVPEAPKQKYRVEYFDPAKGEMTHSYFDSMLEGDTFTSTLTDAQKSKGVKAYFELTTEPSFGEEPQVPAVPEIEAKKADIERRRQKVYNQQYNDLVAGKVLDNEGNPVYEEDKGVGANGLATLTDKKYGHGHIRTSGLDSLKVLEDLLGGAEFSGMFGGIGEGAYSTWESGKFIIVSNNINPTKNGKLNLNEVEIILNAGLTPFAQELANKYPNVIIKDFNGKKYDAELAALGVGEEAAPQVPATPEGDIEKTLYGTISGSIPLKEALPNGVYVDLGDNLFAYADKNEKIAAIVDKANGYLVSKSFWNPKENKWQLPNQANLRDDAKRLGINENEYIRKYQDAVNSLNASGEVAPQVPAAPVEVLKDVESTAKALEKVPEEKIDQKLATLDIPVKLQDSNILSKEIERQKTLRENKKKLGKDYSEQDEIILNLENQVKSIPTKGQQLAEAYYLAKSSGKETELTKAVEDLLVGEEVAPQVPAAPITEEKIKTEEDAIPEPSPEGVLQPEQERIGEEGGERRGVESPVERVAAAQEGKVEAAKKEIAKREKAYAPPEGRQLEVNKLVGELYKFNQQKRGRLGLKTIESLKKRNELLIEAKRLGFETKVDREGRIYVKKARAVDKSNSNMAIDSKFVPLEKRSEKLRNLYNKIQGFSQKYGGDFQSFMPNVIVGADGKKMNNKQIANALKDLENGIPSKGANLILNDLEAMAESGIIEVRDGQNLIGLPIDEFFKELERQAEGDIDRVLGEEVETLPETDLVKWFEEMEAEQQFESEIYEEPITPEALPEGGVEPEVKKEVPKPVRPTAAKPAGEAGRGAPSTEGGPKLKEEVIPPVPPTPPKPKEEEGYESRERDKALLNRLYTAKNIPEEARIGFEREGLRYQTKSQKEAELIAKGVIDELGIDEALNLASSFEFDGDVNSLIYAESLNRLAEMEKQAKTKEEGLVFAKKFAEVGIEYGEKSQYGGRFNAAINYFYQKSPLGIVIMEDMKRREEFDKFSKNKEQSWKEAFDILKAELDALKQELEGKKAEPSIRTSEAKIQAARQKRAALKEKYKKGKGGGLTLSSGGLTKEGIEYVGELAITYIQEGVANVEVIIQRIFLDLKDVIGKSIDEETAKQVESEVRKTFKEKKGKSVLNRIRKRLEKLSKKKQDEVIRKSFNQIIESGGLDYDDFRKIIAEVTGYPELTEEQQARFIELVKKTNAVERMAEKAREDRTEKSLKDFRNAEIEAGKAARELNQLVWNKPDIVKRLTSIMQLSTLGIPALINNPIYNIWNQATLRLPVGLFNDLVDRGITLAAQATGTEYQREYNVLGTQKEFFKKLGFGTKESVEQLITGLNRQDYIQKEVGGQQIQPLQAAKDWWASLTGKKKLTTAQIWDKGIQATVGVPAEAIARTLNIGDKPQRFAAEGAQAAAFAKSFGLKDLDYRLFIEFPREEAYRIYKSQGLSDVEAARKADYIKDVIIKEGQRATFQQDNLVNTALSAVFNTVFGKGKETGLANLVKATTVSPYIKIPTNAFWSYYNLVNPEIALLQAFAHGGRAFYLNKAGEDSQAKLALRESRYWLAHSITGMAMKAVVIALVKAAVYNAGSDEEESKREREGKAFYEGQGTVNIDKLNAILSGEDPTQVKTGLLIPNRWFGQWGTVGNAIARKYENMTPEQKKAEAGYYDFMLGELSTDVLQELEQGIFANTSSLLSYLNTGNPNRYLTNTLNMFTNIVHPAALAQISRAQIPNYTTQKADTFLKELENAMLTRSSFIRELTGKYPPSKISIWGDPIQKQGGTVQKLFNITRVNKDMFARPLYDDAKKYNDINFFPPAVTSSLNGKQLTVDQTRTLQEFVGAARKARISPYINDSAKLEGYNVLYSDLKNPEDKKKVLNYLYEKGRVDGINKFYNQYKDLKPKEKTEDFLEELQFDLFKTLQKYK